jgi:tetratricopeptide (TPR) repeat protein
VITLALVLLLGAKAPPPAKPAAPAAPAAAPATPAATPAAPPAAPAAAGETADSEVLGFLSLTNSTAARDGGVKLPWDGPGGPELKLSWDALDKRNESLAMGDMMARALIESVRMFFDSDGGLDPEGMRVKLTALTGGPMEDARAAYLDAVTWEERRLFFVERAVVAAEQQQAGLPGVDAALVDRRLRLIRSGAVKKAVGAQIDGYRDLAIGLVAYLDGDNFKALEKVRTAATALPDFAVAHAFLGSMYFLFDQKDAAVREWRRSYELDPTNEAVKSALMEYGRNKGKKTADTKSPEKDARP